MMKNALCCMCMNLSDLEAFVAVAEMGSIQRAALRLHLSQPATTRRVQNFEAALGDVALLDRNTKPPLLTPLGRQVLAHCRGVLKATAELEASVAGAGEPTGDLRLGIAHGLGEGLLASPLDELGRRFPGLRLCVSSDWTGRLIEDVRSGALDCAIGLVTSEQRVPAGVVAATLGSERVLVVTARGTGPHGKGPSRAPLKDLADSGWVLNPAGCGCRAALQRACDREAVPLRVTAEVLGEDLQLSFIARGAGLGLVPERQLAANPHRAQLRTLKVSDFQLILNVTLLHGPVTGRLAPAISDLQARIAGRLTDHVQRA